MHAVTVTVTAVTAVAARKVSAALGRRRIDQVETAADAAFELGVARPRAGVDDVHVHAATAQALRRRERAVEPRERALRRPLRRRDAVQVPLRASQGNLRERRATRARAERRRDA